MQSGNVCDVMKPCAVTSCYSLIFQDCKVYLCGTKKDLLDKGLVSREVPEDIVATYSQGLCGHYLTSSKTGENVGKKLS